MKDRKLHWENIYNTKKFTEVSWYQPKPEVSLNFIAQFDHPKDARIIDIGGGDSFLVDFLLQEEYTNITVLDISEKALNRAKDRLGGDKALNVNWITADAVNIQLNEPYDIWHDRAAFHFLTNKKDIDDYLNTLEKLVKPGGNVILGTFSDKGPDKCSGIEIKQYSADEMSVFLSPAFELSGCENLDHTTPTGNIQNFTFCLWKKQQV